MDPLALIRCRLVSKYWRHHAIKSRVENEVVDAYDSAMKSAALPAIPVNEISGDLHRRPSIWFDEPKYPRNLLLRDRALAVKHGKQLLEIDTRALNTVIKAFENDKTHADKYLLKTFALKSAIDHCSVSMGDYQAVQFQEESVKGFKWDDIAYYSEVDIMFDLADYYDTAKRETRTQTVLSVRERHPTKYFGFVPLDSHFLEVLAFIFVPLIVHDVLNSAFLSVVKTWFGPGVFLLTCVLNFIIVNDFLSGRRFTGSYRTVSMILIVGYVVLSALAYPYSLTYHSAVGMMGFTFVYVVLVYEYTIRWGVKLDTKRAMPAIIAVLLVLTMNDWKVTVDSIKNGVIWFRLFDNTVCYAIMCLHFIVLNSLSHLGGSRGWEWRYLVDWDKSAVKMLVKSYSIVVFISLYGPTWPGNHV
jgi:hypothetical protein